MRRFILFSLALLLALVACGQPTATLPLTPTLTVAPPVTPTVTLPPSTVTPSPTPEPITLQKTFGLTGDALKAFSGAEKLIACAEKQLSCHCPRPQPRNW